MICKNSIKHYKGISLKCGSGFLYIPPHTLLQSYISNYTISFPTLQSMPDEYTVLPTASSTLVISVGTNSICYGLRGVNTMPCNVGAYANKMKLLVLIEFHPGGLFPFIEIDQSKSVDSSYKLEELDKILMQTLENELLKSDSIEALVNALNRVFLKRLMNSYSDKGISMIMYNIFEKHGNISLKELSSKINYSEKQIRRLFIRYVGITPKMFSRIVRANYAIHIMKKRPINLMNVALEAGFFDQSHFINDFKMICGLTPQEYRQNMSLFYNDKFKM